MSYAISLYVRESTQKEVVYPKELKRNKVLYGCQHKATFWLIGMWDRFEAIAKFFKNWDLHYVGIGTIKDLKKRCEKIKLNHDLAESLLPTTQGYDDYYFEQLEETRKLMNRIIYLFKRHDQYSLMVEIG